MIYPTVSALTKKTPSSPLLTGADLAEMEDIGHYELVEGEIVKMSPTKIQHGLREFRFAKLLSDFLDEHDLGEVMVGEVGIYTQRNPDTIRGADVVYISYGRLNQASEDDFLDVAPELVVEIMSPNDRWGEVRRKLREYFEIGVSAVLIVEPKEKTISLFRSPTTLQELTEAETLTLEDILPGFAVPVSAFFAKR